MDGAKLKLSQLECVQCHSVTYLAFNGADRHTKPVRTCNGLLHLLLGVFPGFSALCACRSPSSKVGERKSNRKHILNRNLVPKRLTILSLQLTVTSYQRVYVFYYSSRIPGSEYPERPAIIPFKRSGTVTTLKNLTLFIIDIVL